jgi:hypothetical protein
MRNASVVVAKNGKSLNIVIDLAGEAEASKSGKFNILASSAPFETVSVGGVDYKLSLMFGTNAAKPEKPEKGKK